VIGWENAYWIACFVLDTGLRAEELRVRGALVERHEQALHGRPILRKGPGMVGWESACWIACFVLDKKIRAEELWVRGALAERHQKTLHGRPVLKRRGAMGDWMGECVLDSVFRVRHGVTSRRAPGARSTCGATSKDSAWPSSPEEKRGDG